MAENGYIDFLVNHIQLSRKLFHITAWTVGQSHDNCVSKGKQSSDDQAYIEFTKISIFETVHFTITP